MISYFAKHGLCKINNFQQLHGVQCNYLLNFTELVGCLDTRQAYCGNCTSNSFCLHVSKHNHCLI